MGSSGSSLEKVTETSLKSMAKIRGYERGWFVLTLFWVSWAGEECGGGLETVGDVWGDED